MKVFDYMRSLDISDLAYYLERSFGCPPDEANIRCSDQSDCSHCFYRWLLSEVENGSVPGGEDVTD